MGKCPYCDFEFPFKLKEDGKAGFFECESCHKQFNAEKFLDKEEIEEKKRIITVDDYSYGTAIWMRTTPFIQWQWLTSDSATTDWSN